MSATGCERPQVGSRTCESLWVAATPGARQLGGHMSRQYDAWREEIIGCLAHVEAFIDFADEEDDVTEAVYAAVIPR